MKVEERESRMKNEQQYKGPPSGLLGKSKMKVEQVGWVSVCWPRSGACMGVC